MCVYDGRVFMIPYADPGYVRILFLLLACYHKMSDPGVVCSLLFVLPDFYIVFLLCLCVPLSKVCVRVLPGALRDARLPEQPTHLPRLQRHHRHRVDTQDMG
jgi:hypothetical protein